MPADAPAAAPRRERAWAPRAAWAWAALTAAVVIGADQLAKSAVRSSIGPADTRDVLPGLQFVHSTNHGVAFGILPHDPGVVVAIIAVALVALLVYFSRHATRRLAWLPTGLLIGGAVGNIIDRIVHGSVTDFIKVPLWPAFNLADASITVGVLALLLFVESG